MAADRGMAARFRDPNVLAGVGSCVLVLAHVAYYFPRVVDDVFISLRYAENLAAGRGAVYNLGERVEGYSSPAWMFIQAFGLLCRFEAVTFGKLVGIVCLLATAFGTRAIARKMYGVSGWPSWIPAYGVALNSYLVNWTVLGLETPFYVAALVLCPLAIHEALTAPSRKTYVLAAAAIVMLGAARPEASLYVIANCAAPFAFVRTRSAFVDRIKEGWRFVVPAGAVLASLLALRFAYYRELVPNTYFVKGAGAAFSLEKLAALWGQGATVPEALLFCGGIALLAFYSVRKRQLAPMLTTLLCLYFTASVAVDWMPSLRHLLPVTVFAPIGWACLLSDIRESKRDNAFVLGQIGFVYLAVTAILIARVDVRLSTIEHRDRWIVRKTTGKCSDTVLAYRRIEPPHVTKMADYDMGQISQSWAVLETSREPVEASWYAARDIGAVGYYTGVRVYDTAGLVTREVARSKAWTVDNVVTDELVQSMMAKRPLATDIFDGWDTTLGRHPELLAGYRVRMGTRSSPNEIIATDRPKPDHAEVVRRYRAFVAKFPQLYHLHTLYGESMGAVAERRLRIVSAH